MVKFGGIDGWQLFALAYVQTDSGYQVGFQSLADPSGPYQALDMRVADESSLPGAMVEASIHYAESCLQVSPAPLADIAPSKQRENGTCTIR